MSDSDSDSDSYESDYEIVTTNSRSLCLKQNIRDKNYQLSNLDKIETAKEYGDVDHMWENGMFRECSDKFDKESEIIKNPFPVSECSEPCPRKGCGSERTLTYHKQTRSADEATTVFIFCGKCGKVSRL